MSHTSKPIIRPISLWFGHRARASGLWMTSCLPMIGQANVMQVASLLKVTHQGVALD